VGVQLAGDLARSGSNAGAAAFQKNSASRFTTAAQPIATKVGSHSVRWHSSYFG
jgi:hypothetical protein